MYVILLQLLNYNYFGQYWNHNETKFRVSPRILFTATEGSTGRHEPVVLDPQCLYLIQYIFSYYYTNLFVLFQFSWKDRYARPTMINGALPKKKTTGLGYTLCLHVGMWHTWYCKVHHFVINPTVNATAEMCFKWVKPNRHQIQTMMQYNYLFESMYIHRTWKQLYGWQGQTMQQYLHTHTPNWQRPSEILLRFLHIIIPLHLLRAFYITTYWLVHSSSPKNRQ